MKAQFLGVLIAGLCLTPLQRIEAETIRLAASTPMPSYADPLVIDSGNGVIPAVFDALTIVDDDGRLLPSLAIGWNAVDDTTWHFQLRPDIRFSNGMPLDAALVAEYLSFLAAPDSLIFPIARETDSIVSARALDALTVEVSTRQSDAVLARKLSRIPIFPLSVWKEMGRTEFSKAPVGTGPYVISEWGAGGASGVTITQAGTSWRKIEQVETVEYIILTDPSSRLQSLLSDAVDIAAAIDVDSIPTAEAAGYRIRAQLGPMVLALAFHNCGEAGAAMKDLRVRKALTIGVDRQRIVESLMGSDESLIRQGGTPGILGYSTTLDPFDFDPEGAKVLLSEAGYAGDEPLVVGVFTGQFASDTLMYQLVAQYWSDIGVRSEIRRLAFPEYIRRMESMDWEGIDAMSAVWSHYQLGDVSRSLKRFAGAHPAPFFCAPELVDEVLATDAVLDEAERDAQLQSLMARLHDQVPSLPLVQYVSVVGHSPRLVEYTSRTGAILFEQMQLRD